jgi:cupin fold WbuC family metalloprotein
VGTSKIMNYIQLNEEVLVSKDKFIKLDREYIHLLKKKAAENTRKRIRICIHRNDREMLQEMFIIHMKGAYVRPHKHLKKSESLHVIEGMADIVFFDEKGKIMKVLQMGDNASGKVFYYKIDKPTYHSMIIKSKYLVFHEVTKGPFQRSETVFAPWSPDGSNKNEVCKYIDDLKKKIKNI